MVFLVKVKSLDKEVINNIFKIFYLSYLELNYYVFDVISYFQWLFLKHFDMQKKKINHFKK